MLAQQLEVKILASEGGDVASETLIPIFHRWIRENRLGEDKLLIDVADYSHVPNGPGVMIVGHGLQYRMDEASGQLGLLFARKRDEPGPLADKLTEAFAHALEAAHALEQEPTVNGQVSFAGDRVEVTIMSRLYASSDAETFAELEPELRAFAARLYGDDVEVEISRRGDDRTPLSATLVAARTPGAKELLQRL